MKKKIDNRIRTLLETGVTLNQRTMFFIVGNEGRNQVVILHHMLSKAVVKARPSVLWCYKKELGFSSHRRKRMKKIQVWLWFFVYIDCVYVPVQQITSMNQVNGLH